MVNKDIRLSTVLPYSILFLNWTGEFPPTTTSDQYQKDAPIPIAILMSCDHSIYYGLYVYTYSMNEIEESRV